VLTLERLRQEGCGPLNGFVVSDAEVYLADKLQRIRKLGETARDRQMQVERSKLGLPSTTSQVKQEAWTPVNACPTSSRTETSFTP
jgi:hypothetical protein